MIKKIIRIPVRATFTTELLGSASGDPRLHSTYIASKAPDAEKMEEEIAEIGVEGVEEKKTTIFHHDEEGRPFLKDYQIRGFFKGSCGALRRIKDTEASKIKAYKSVIDTLLMVEPRNIYLHFPGDKIDIDVLQRSLRASTPQGDRVALASSEQAPIDTYIDFDVILLQPELESFVYEALDYGIYHGIGQWRGGGYGRFTWDEREKI